MVYMIALYELGEFIKCEQFEPLSVYEADRVVCTVR